MIEPLTLSQVIAQVLNILLLFMHPLLIAICLSSSYYRNLPKSARIKWAFVAILIPLLGPLLFLLANARHDIANS